MLATLAAPGGGDVNAFASVTESPHAAMEMATTPETAAKPRSLCFSEGEAEGGELLKCSTPVEVVV